MNLITEDRCETCKYFRKQQSYCNRYPPRTHPVVVGMQAKPGSPVPEPIIHNVIAVAMTDPNMPACGEYKRGLITS